MANIKHNELCKLGSKWLKDLGCSVVIVEKKGMNNETPDCIGWYAECSILIECKTLRKDFLKDQRKPFRINPEKGMGVIRIYLAPKGLISIDELPEKWGLLEVNNNNKIEYTKCFRYNIFPDEYRQEPNHYAEKLLLLSLIRREVK